MYFTRYTTLTGVSYSGNVKRSDTCVTKFLLSLEFVYFCTSCIAGNVGLSNLEWDISKIVNLVYLCCHFELYSYRVIYGY